VDIAAISLARLSISRPTPCEQIKPVTPQQQIINNITTLAVKSDTFFMAASSGRVRIVIMIASNGGKGNLTLTSLQLAWRGAGLDGANNRLFRF
jgi:hypothetical protein